MSNRINPYTAALNPFQQATRREGGRTEQSAQPVPATSPARPEPARPAAQAAVQDLSRAEQQLIDRYFPASEAMTLRVYGANRGAQTINPGALGSRLDLKG